MKTKKAMFAGLGCFAVIIVAILAFACVAAAASPEGYYVYKGKYAEGEMIIRPGNKTEWIADIHTVYAGKHECTFTADLTGKPLPNYGYSTEDMMFFTMKFVGKKVFLKRIIKPGVEGTGCGMAGDFDTGYYVRSPKPKPFR